MSKRKEIAYQIAKYMVNPVDGIEIGGVSAQLLDIVKVITKENRSLRREVLDWLCYFSDSESRYEELRDEYDRFFYQLT